MTSCGLCLRQTIHSGKDELLYEDDFCYIVNNGGTHLKDGDNKRFAKKRISLVLREHTSQPSDKECRRAESALRDFMTNHLKLVDEKEYFLRRTMNTYPDHYHLHAYIFPWSDTGAII